MLTVRFNPQITEFEDHSFALGLSCTHMHADPTCAMLFIKAWGDAHRRTYIANPPFFHPPSLLPRPSPNPSSSLLSEKSTTTTTSTTPLRLSSATFRFSDQSIKTLLNNLPANSTPFSAVASLFWLAIARAKKSVDIDKKSTMTICVDFRKKLQAPLPHGFYGNALHFSRAEAELREGWGHVSEAVALCVEGIEEEEYWSAIEWLDARKGEEAFTMYGPELTCMSLDHVFAYGAAFEKEGGGKVPAHVSFWVGGVDVEGAEGVMVVMPAAEEGVGRVVAVTLPEVVLELVCKDDDVLRHGPTVMFKGESRTHIG